MTDPVQDANDEDKAQVLELAQLDAQLDDKQRRLDELAHRDPIGYVFFGDNDDWVNKRLS